MDDTSPDRGEAFASRRRVIKGLASTIPVALTLSNGAAMANTSNYQCIATQPPGAEPDCGVGSPPDNTWLYDLVSPPATSPGDEQNTLGDKYCVRYVDPTGNTTGYSYSYLNQSSTVSHVFINQDGTEVPGGLSGNPLSGSCAGSFGI